MARRKTVPSAPASTSIALPASRTRIASPWPTSRTTIEAALAGAGPAPSASDPATTPANTRAATVRDDGSGHHAHTTAAQQATATAIPPPAPSATAAPGSRASPAASHAVASSTAAAPRMPSAPRAGTTEPATAPPSPSQSARVTSGEASALATGASTESIPNVEALTVTVAACATPVSASAVVTGRQRAPNAASVQAEASPPNRSSPPTASADSWNPTSKTVHGSKANTAMTATASDATPSALRPASCANPPTTSIKSDRRAEYGIPVTTAYAAPVTTVMMTSGRRGTRAMLPSSATAPHASARWDPETATRCDSPSVRKSSSATVPIRRRRSPSTMPSTSAPPAPGMPCIPSRTDERHASSSPTGPGRHAPVSARHARPVAHAPVLATRRLQTSSTGRGSSTAENRTVRPRSGTEALWGQLTRTRAPSSGPPRTRTLTVVPNVPALGSASTKPDQTRAPASSESALWRCHAAAARAETSAPVTAPASTRTATARQRGRHHAPQAMATPAPMVTAGTLPGPRPLHAAHETVSASTHPPHIAAANHATGGTTGRRGPSFI